MKISLGNWHLRWSSIDPSVGLPVVSSIPEPVIFCVYIYIVFSGRQIKGQDLVGIRKTVMVIMHPVAHLRIWWKKWYSVTCSYYCWLKLMINFHGRYLVDNTPNTLKKLNHRSSNLIMYRIVAPYLFCSSVKISQGNWHLERWSFIGPSVGLLVVSFITEPAIFCVYTYIVFSGRQIKGQDLVGIRKTVMMIMHPVAYLHIWWKKWYNVTCSYYCWLKNRFSWLAIL